MKVLFFGSVLLLVSLVALRAQTPGHNTPPGPLEHPTATNAQPVTLAPAKKKKNPAAAPTTPETLAVASKPVPAKPPASVLDNYMNDLGDALPLTANEKKQIQSYYLADDAELKNILHDNTLSPWQQAQQVSDLRDRRNDKIEALLTEPEQRKEFFTVEANYRVALVEAAAK